MKRIKKRLIVNLISWLVSLILSICVIILSVTLKDEYAIGSKILLISGIIDSVFSAVILVIFVPYNYHLDKDIDRFTKELWTNKGGNNNAKR